VAVTETFQALREAQFRRVWAAGLVSSTGDWMQIVGRSYLAFSLTGRAESVGIVYFAAYAPQLVFSLWGGVLADRFDRRRLLLGTQVIAAAGAVGFGLLTTTGSATVANVAVASFVLGIAQMLSIPAMQALMPSVVPRDALSSAISLSTATNSLARVVGPLLAALVIGGIGIEWVFWANAVSFVAVIVAWLVTRVPRPPAMAESRSLAAIGAALWYVRSTPTVAVPIVASTFLMAVGVVYQPLAVVFTTDVLAHGSRSLGSDYYGWYQAAIGVGAAVGILASAGPGRRHPARTFLMTAIGYSVAVTVLGLTSSLGPALAVVCVVGALHFANVTLGLNLVQHEVPEEMRGRVMAIHMIGLVGVVPITALVGGLVADAIGIRQTFVVGGLACLAFSLLLVRWRRFLRVAEVEPETPETVSEIGVVVNEDL